MLAPTPAERRAILEETFHFHPLAIEDCLTRLELPKVEVYENYLFLTFHEVDFNRETESFEVHEMDMFIGKNFLVTFHEAPLRSIQAAIDRCVKNPTQITRGPDRVAHSILDALVDNYLPVLNSFADQVNEFERLLVDDLRSESLQRIMKLKREINKVGQIIRPQREIVHRFVRSEFPLIRAKLIPYYRDVYDHLTRYQDLADNYRDSLNSTLEVLLSFSANQTSEVVKVLTLITVISTPATIIASWYGMNFHDMPEVNSPHGYWVAILVTILSTMAFVWWFKKRRWL
ncbi:MAG: magnesium/cobalt transporter CorA [Verrucomicrobiae bacterium]|nr:magnesium/cobalt transporter CorA [Verrucomicrobiae bacterium]